MGLDARLVYSALVCLFRFFFFFFCSRKNQVLIFPRPEGNIGGEKKVN